MRDNKSPFQLVQMPGVIVERLTSGALNEYNENSENHENNENNENHENNELQGPKHFKQKFNDRYPLFSWF
jgi:hypothetical protein